MSDYQDQWAKGYREGWREQSTMTPPEPTIPTVPTIPADVVNREDWAYEEGKKRGAIDRQRVLAGLA